AAAAGMDTSTGSVPLTGRALPFGRRVIVAVVGETVQPSGASTFTVTFIGFDAGPVTDTPTSIRSLVVPVRAGITTGCAGDVVAAREYVGTGTGMSAISALIALAWVRQSKTLGCSGLVPPAQRVPRRLAASRSRSQMVSACLAMN